MSGTRHRTRPALTAFLHRLAPRTLRGRLSLVALTTAALLMLILTVAFNAVAQHRLQHQADDELRTRAAAVATTIDTTGTTVRVLETSNDALLDTNVWIYADGRLLEEPPNAGPLTRVADALAGHGGRRCVTAGVDGPLRLCSQPVSGDNSEATVVTALGLSPYRSSADTLLLGSLALDAVMLACTYALTRLAVGRALRPVRTMTDQATQWSAVASEERFGHTRHPSELTRLGTSLDAILDRIRTLLRHERQLTGELSHELRTPLSRIIAELDWWQTRPRTADQTHATHKVIAEAAQSMRTICDTLLDAPAAAHPPLPAPRDPPHAATPHRSPRRTIPLDGHRRRPAPGGRSPTRPPRTHHQPAPDQRQPIRPIQDHRPRLPRTRRRTHRGHRRRPRRTAPVRRTALRARPTRGSRRRTQRSGPGTAAGATPGPLRRRRDDVRPRPHPRGTVCGQPACRVTAAHLGNICHQGMQHLCQGDGPFLLLDRDRPVLGVAAHPFDVGWMSVTDPDLQAS